MIFLLVSPRLHARLACMARCPCMSLVRVRFITWVISPSWSWLAMTSSIAVAKPAWHVKLLDDEAPSGPSAGRRFYLRTRTACSAIRCGVSRLVS